LKPGRLDGRPAHNRRVRPPFRYGASGGSEFVPLEVEQDEENDEAIEILPADLLDELAAAIATA
jgi:hypothetical protein